MISEFADDHEEVHAIGTGIGLGLAAAATDHLQLLAIAGTIAVQAIERKRRPAPKDRQHLGNDIRREPHYFVAAVAVGAILGTIIQHL
jgi:hypothetical protein